jgi:diguanylate cyclase
VSHESVKTARAALYMLTARGLPPTPENYTRVYREILGEPSPPEVEQSLTTEQKLDNSRELVDLIRTLVSAVTEKTGHLVDDLGQKSRDMQKSIDALENAEEKQEIANLLNIIVCTTHTIQSTVEDAHQEILSSQHTLEEMRNELQEVKRQVLLDPLTGARNRFGMDASVGQELSRARRNGSKFTLAMIDIDYFKKINDEYGHEVGDFALVYFSRLSHSVLRESDTLYRYGGEEFLVVLPDTDIEGAMFMFDRLRQMLSKSPLIHGSKKIRMTFSGGIASMRNEDDSHSLQARADQALYQAKQQGRDRVLTDQGDK